MSFCNPVCLQARKRTLTPYGPHEALIELEFPFPGSLTSQFLSWEFQFPFPGSLTSTFLQAKNRTLMPYGPTKMLIVALYLPSFPGNEHLYPGA